MEVQIFLSTSDVMKMLENILKLDKFSKKKTNYDKKEDLNIRHLNLQTKKLKEKLLL